MTDQEYRQDDRTDVGYCPKCGEQVTTVFVDGGGWCPDHGRVWCDWTPPEPARFDDHSTYRTWNDSADAERTPNGMRHCDYCVAFLRPDDPRVTVNGHTYCAECAAKLNLI